MSLRSLACACLGVTLAGGVSTACTSGEPELAADAATPPTPTPDAFVVPADGGIPPEDAGRDAGSAPADDAGPVCACELAACELGECVDGDCRRWPSPRGSECGESRVCSEGRCFERFGCGDGYREGAGDAREGCDDGNLEDGDGCGASCVPEVLTLAARHPVTSATDPWGTTLFVWSEPREAGYAIVAQRLGVDGLEPERVLAETAGGVDPRPTVLAMHEGFVVAHLVTDDDEGDIALVRLGAAPIERAFRRDDTQRDVALMRWGFDGLAVFFVDVRDGTLWMQVLDEDLRAVGEARLLAEDAELPSVAGDEGRWLAAWTELGDIPHVVARTSDGELVDLGEGFAPRVAEGADGWLVAFATRSEDPRGDLVLATLDDAGAVLERRFVASTEEAELAPALATSGDAMVLAYERGSVLTGAVRDLGLASSDAVPETDALFARLAGDGHQRSPRVAAAGDAFWITWLDASGSDARARAFRLPVD